MVDNKKQAIQPNQIKQCTLCYVLHSMLSYWSTRTVRYNTL